MDNFTFYSPTKFCFGKNAEDNLGELLDLSLIHILFDLTGVEDPVKEIRALTPDGRGADSAIDASGQPAAWENAINIVRKAGFVNLFGGCKMCIRDRYWDRSLPGRTQCGTEPGREKRMEE